MQDRALKRVTLEFRESFLEGGPSNLMCFAICCPLQGYLSWGYKLHTKLIEADFGHCNHYWLELEDSRILDPTADQFSRPGLKLPKVYLGPVPKVYRQWMAAKPRKEGR